jgi:serine/threonine protein kinase
MTSELWQRIRALVEEALLLPVSEREAYLQAHASSEEIAHEARLLLACSTDASEILSLDALDKARAGAIEGAIDDVSLDDTVLGNYRILHELGRGGMGAVYLAERADGEYRQQVAVKVLQEHISTAALVRRFREERQILATLSHPGIARLLDGGITPAGRPYLVLEYVEGLPIDRYCADQKLTVPAILRLILQVAEAVQSAHQSLVLHLDLKPANILVTADGQPRLLDFGISRWLDATSEGHPDTEATLRLLTPRYASPEQASGAPLGVASDVFSLGTLLYKLLTGALPYALDGASPFEATQILRDVQPATPSSVAPQEVAAQLRGDLDTILLQALRKEPARRYATIAAFAEDIQRHLDSRPVLAHADSFGYRSAKFFHRNRIASSIAAVAILLLTVAGVAVVRSDMAARRERAAAERSLAGMREIAHSYTLDLIPDLSDIPGTLAVSHKVMDRAVRYLDLMSQQAAPNEDLNRELSLACYTLGRLKGGTFSRSLGDRPGAIQLLDRGIVIQRRIVADNPGNHIDKARLSDLMREKGNILVAMGDITQGLALDRQAWDLLHDVLADGPAKGPIYINSFTLAWHIGMDYASAQQWNLGDPNEGLKWADQMDTLLDTFGAAKPAARSIPTFIAEQSDATNLRIDALDLLGRRKEQEALLLSLMAEQDKTAGLKSRLLELQRRQTHSRYAQLLYSRGDFAGAAAASGVMRVEAKTKFAAEVNTSVDDLDSADNTCWLAVIDWRTGHKPESQAERKQCLTIYRANAAQNPGLSWPVYSLQNYLQDFAELPGFDPAEAIALDKEALAIVSPYVASHPEVLSAHIAEAHAHAGLARLYLALHQTQEAEQETARARALLTNVLAKHPELATAQDILKALPPAR